MIIKIVAIKILGILFVLLGIYIIKDEWNRKYTVMGTYWRSMNDFDFIIHEGSESTNYDSTKEKIDEIGKE